MRPRPQVEVGDEAFFSMDSDVCGILLQYPATDGSIFDYKVGLGLGLGWHLRGWVLGARLGWRLGWGWAGLAPAGLRAGLGWHFGGRMLRSAV